MPTPFGNVTLPRPFASRNKMKDFTVFLFSDDKSPTDRIIIPDEIGGELTLTKVHMLEVEVDGVKIDGAYVSIKDALVGAIRTFKRVRYIDDRVSILFFAALLVIMSRWLACSCIGFATVGRVS